MMTFLAAVIATVTFKNSKDSYCNNSYDDLYNCCDSYNNINCYNSQL